MSRCNKQWGGTAVEIETSLTDGGIWAPDVGTVAGIRSKNCSAFEDGDASGPSEIRGHVVNFTSRVISAFKSFETGQLTFAFVANAMIVASSAPGTLATRVR